MNLFGVGIQGKSPAITAQLRVNCYVEKQQEADRTSMALIGSPGLKLFTTITGQPSRGMWAVNTLSQPLLFSVHGNTLYAANNAGVVSTIGTLNTSGGNVSMADDGTYLVIVDGTNGYYYNMIVPSFVQITDGNFTTTPKYVTWNDTYFIVSSGATNQWQASANGNPAVWPATQINFTAAGPSAIQAILADHSIINIFNTETSEFWQDTGSADNPFGLIPGSAQEYGLKSAWSLAKSDNSMIGLFSNKEGESFFGRMSGFRVDAVSSLEVDTIINAYTNLSNAKGFAYRHGGHPMYQASFPDVDQTLEYDGSQKVWCERQAPDGGRYWAQHFAAFVNKRLVSDYRNGNIYELDANTYTDNGEYAPMEVRTKHIWNDDKYLSVSNLQIDVQAGVGLTTGQGSDPQLMLDVSKNGGNTFKAVSWSSMGKVGQYTQRVIWRNLGAARDWVLKLRITDPVKRVITGASANITGGSF